MEARELRIGNYVSAQFGHGYEQEEIVSIDTLQRFDGEHVLYCGIPITEQWLERMGFNFEPSDGGNDFWQNDAGLTIYESAVKGEYFCDVLFNYSDIKHVHQIQNLYFALTGQELEVKQIAGK